MIRRTFLLGVLTLVLFTLSGCFRTREPVWVYTSLYPDTIAELQPLLSKALPDLDVKWFNSGSEVIASTLGAELEAGVPRADLLMTADPILFAKLKKEGRLAKYRSPSAAGVAEELVDPDSRFSAVRGVAVVIGYNSKVLSGSAIPKSWHDLADPRWKGRVTMADPLDSGTAFSSLAILNARFGWEAIENMLRNSMLLYGGSRTVIRRVELKLHPVAILSMEDIVRAQRQGSPVRAVLPSEGSIVLPGRIGILSTTRKQRAAERIYDWFFSRTVQDALVKNGMYSPLPGFPAPHGAPAWETLLSSRLRLTDRAIEQAAAGSGEFREKLARIIRREHGI